MLAGVSQYDRRLLLNVRHAMIAPRCLLKIQEARKESRYQRGFANIGRGNPIQCERQSSVVFDLPTVLCRSCLQEPHLPRAGEQSPHSTRDVNCERYKRDGFPFDGMPSFGAEVNVLLDEGGIFLCCVIFPAGSAQPCRCLYRNLRYMGVFDTAQGPAT